MAAQRLVFIIGGGKTGSYLATLLQKSCDIRVIENRPNIYERLKRELPGNIIYFGDGTDPALLETLGIAKADVVAAVTGDDETNLVACSLAKFEYQVERVIMRVNNPRNAWLCTPEMGVDVAINQSDFIASIIVEEMAPSDMLTLARLRQGQVQIVEEIIQPNSSVIGKKLAQLGLPQGCNIAAIIRNEAIIIPDGSTVLQAGDETVTVMDASKRSALQKIFEATQG